MPPSSRNSKNSPQTKKCWNVNECVRAVRGKRNICIFFRGSPAALKFSFVSIVLSVRVIDVLSTTAAKLRESLTDHVMNSIDTLSTFSPACRWASICVALAATLCVPCACLWQLPFASVFLVAGNLPFIGLLSAVSLSVECPRPR